MSLEIIATIICDTCGIRRPSETGNTIGGAKWLVQEHRSALEKSGWHTMPRGKFHTPAHYCPDCTDKPMRPIKGKPRWKGPLVTDAIRSALKPACEIPERGGVWVLIVFGNRLTIASPCKCIGFGDGGTKIVYNLRGRRKPVTKDQIMGWITHKELSEIIGEQPDL